MAPPLATDMPQALHSYKSFAKPDTVSKMRQLRSVFGKKLPSRDCLPSIAIPAVIAGHERVGELPICLWFVCQSVLVDRVAAPTAKTTRNARDSGSVGPIAIYISGIWVLSSAAAQDERRADQDAEKERCFHLRLVPCLFYLSSNSEPPQTQAVIPYFPDHYPKDPRTAQAGLTNRRATGKW